MLVQTAGRVSRSEFPTVINMVDNDNIYKNHWYKARKWYIARGGLPTEHNTENTESPTIANITEGQIFIEYLQQLNQLADPIPINSRK